MTRGRSWKIWAALTVITAVAAGIRLVGLGRGLNLLEVNSFWYGRMPLGYIFQASDYFPHLYALVHLCAPVLGDSEAALRLPFVLAGILQVPVLFLLGGRLFGERVGLLSAFLVAISPFHIHHSQTARYYVLLMLYASFMLYALLAAWEARGWRRALAWGGFTAAAVLNLHTHLFALYALALSLVSALMFLGSSYSQEGGRGLWKKVWPLGPVLAVCVVCGLDTWKRYWFFLWSQLSSGRLLWETTASRVFNPGNIFVQILDEFSGGGRAAVLFSFLAVAAVILRRRTHQQALWHLAVWTGLPLASLFILRAHYHFEPWYFSFIAPLWLIWVACGLEAVAEAGARLHPRFGRAAAWAGLALGVVWLNGSVLSEELGHAQSAWKDALGEISGRCVPGDAVFLHPESGRDGPTRFYPLRSGCRLFDLSYLSRPQRERTISLFTRQERIWLAAQATPSVEEQEQAGNIRRLLERVYEPKGEWNHEEILVTQYVKREGISPGAVLSHLDPPSFPDRGASHKAPIAGFSYLGNLQDASEISWTIPRADGPSVRTIHLEAGREAAAPARQGHAYVLSGSVQAADGGIRWQKGDILVWGGARSFFLRAAARSGATLVVLEGTDEPPFLMRLKPGVTLESKPARRRTLGVVLSGRVKLQSPLHGSAEGGTAHFLTGDAFVTGQKYWPQRSMSGIGSEDLVLLVAAVRRRR